MTSVPKSTQSAKTAPTVPPEKANSQLRKWSDLSTKDKVKYVAARIFQVIGSIAMIAAPFTVTVFLVIGGPFLWMAAIGIFVGGYITACAATGVLANDLKVIREPPTMNGQVGPFFSRIRDKVRTSPLRHLAKIPRAIKRIASRIGHKFGRIRTWFGSTQPQPAQV